MSEKLLSFSEFCNENLDGGPFDFDGLGVLHSTLDFTSGVLGSFGVTAPAAMVLDIAHAIFTFGEGKLKWDAREKLDAVCAFMSGLVTLGSIVLIGPAKSLSINLKKGIERVKSLIFNAIKAGTKNAFISLGASTVVAGFLKDLSSIADSAEELKRELTKWFDLNWSSVPGIIREKLQKPAYYINKFYTLIEPVVGAIRWFANEAGAAIAGKRTELADAQPPSEQWVASIDQNRSELADLMGSTA
jgi:hypothetical protein